MKINKLKEKAVRATKGEWVAFISRSSKTFAVHSKGDKRCDDIIGWAGFDGKENAEANAEFIAAANPATVLALLDEEEAAEKQIAELKDENEYIRKRFKELDRMFGKNLLVMQAAIIEWRTTGDAKNGMAWIFNTLFGPGELPSEDEKDAQAYFDREYAPIDKELMELSNWFHEYHKRFKEKQVKSNG